MVSDPKGPLENSEELLLGSQVGIRWANLYSWILYHAVIHLRSRSPSHPDMGYVPFLLYFTEAYGLQQGPCSLQRLMGHQQQLVGQGIQTHRDPPTRNDRPSLDTKLWIFILITKQNTFLCPSL